MKNVAEFDVFTCQCSRVTARSYPGQVLCRTCLSKGVKEPDIEQERPKIDSVRLFPPPSTNNLWDRRGDGKKRTPEYNAWRDRHLPEMASAFWWVKPPISIHINVWGGEGIPETRDLDNFLKAVQDVLTDAISVPDDSVKYIKEVQIIYRERSTPIEPGYIMLRIAEVRR